MNDVRNHFYYYFGVEEGLVSPNFASLTAMDGLRLVAKDPVFACFCTRETQVLIRMTTLAPKVVPQQSLPPEPKNPAVHCVRPRYSMYCM